MTERFPQLSEYSVRVTEQVCWDIKYSGYLSRQDASVERAHKLQKIRIPDDFDYFSVNQLRMEAKEQLAKIRPETIDQASRIRGITPADLAVLVLTLRGHSPKQMLTREIKDTQKNFFPKKNAANVWVHRVSAFRRQKN